VLKTVKIQIEKWLEPKKASHAMSKLHALLSASKYLKQFLVTCNDHCGENLNGKRVFLT
ncbi:unnamed protein product, partial [Sphenostylis stenocarpa]